MACLPNIEPIPRSKINPVFRHTLTDWLDIGQIALLHAIHGRGDLGCRRHIQLGKPLGKRRDASRRQVFNDVPCRHFYSNLYVTIVNGREKRHNNLSHSVVMNFANPHHPVHRKSAATHAPMPRKMRDHHRQHGRDDHLLSDYDPSLLACVRVIRNSVTASMPTRTWLSSTLKI